MERIITPTGATISFDTYGDGPPLVLVHGGFSDHRTNWQECAALLAERFTVVAIARRGRGESSQTTGHGVADEAADVAAVLRHLGEPAFLLGHSYGALCALNAATLCPDRVRNLILYEAPHPHILDTATVLRLEWFGGRGDWDRMVDAFMRDVLQVPAAEVAAIRATPFWQVWTADARATLNDLRAGTRFRFDAGRYAALAMPTLLLVGAESPRELYVTDALAAVLPDARVVELAGQAHEGMTTAPNLFVDAIAAFLPAPAAVA
jgi:pimeloyl-ACP methyl ester carboxylesterase